MANAAPTVLMLYLVLREEAPSLTCWNNLSVFSFPSISEALFTSDSCSPTCCFEHPCSCHFWVSLFLSPDTSLSPIPGISQCLPHPISCSKPPSAVLAQYQPQLQNMFCPVKEVGSPLTKHKLQEGRCHVFITSVIPTSYCLEPGMQ